MTPLEQRVLLSNSDGGYTLAFNNQPSVTGVVDTSSTNMSVSATGGSIVSAVDHSGATDTSLGLQTLYQPGQPSTSGNIEKYYGVFTSGQTVTLATHNLPSGHGLLTLQYQVYVLNQGTETATLSTTDSNAEPSAATDELATSAAKSWFDIDGDHSNTGISPFITPAPDRPDYIYTVSHNFDDIGSDVTFNITVGNLTNSYEKWGIDNISLTFQPDCDCDQSGVNPADGSAHSDAGGVGSSGQGGLGGATTGTSWSNNGYGTLGGDTGNGTTNAQAPLLAQVGPNSLAVIEGGSSGTFFDFNGTSYVPRDGVKETLTHDTTNHVFVVTKSDGSTTTFNDFSSSVASYLQGKAQSVADPGGLAGGSSGGSAASLSYDTSGNLTAITRSTTKGTVITKEQFAYGYVQSPDPNAGKVSSVSLGRKSWDPAPPSNQSEPSSYTPVESSNYTYYGSSDPNGNLGDVQTVTTEDAPGSPIGVNYSRYYTSNSSTGYQGALKYFFGPDSYARLVAYLATISKTPQSASDSDVAAYADDYYEYGSDHRVSLHTVQGGLGTYTYSYGASSVAGTGAPNPNAWQDKTTEVLPDGNQNVYYYNGDGQEMLNVFQQLDLAKTLSSITFSGTTATVTSSGHGYNVGDVVVIRGADQPQYDGTFTVTAVTINTFTYSLASTPASNATGASITARKVLNQWGAFTEYDSQGNAILSAQPSAVALPANITTLESYADLLHNTGSYSTNPSYQYLNNTTGLIDVTDYYASTTATGEGTEAVSGGMSGDGGAAGYIEDTAVEQGQQGTQVPQEKWTYYVRTVNGASTYPIATDTTYGGTGGGDPRATSYFYSWYAGTLQPQTETVVKPPITNGQNSTVNENGPASSATDLTHGDTTTTALDIDGRTTSVTDGDGYATTTSYDDQHNTVTQVVDPTGLALTTVTTSDNLGRPVSVLSPGNNTTYTVRKDAQDTTTGFAYEERVYPGYHQIPGTSTYTTTGPVQVTRYNRPGSFAETLTYAAPVLSSSTPDGSDAIGTIQSLSRELYSPAGLVTEDDRYAALPNTGYSYSTFHLTGTGSNYAATTNSYNSFGDVVQSTDPNGTIDATTYDARRRVIARSVGTSTGNLVQTESDVYDNGGAGDGNLTQVTDYPGGSAPNRVTKNWFDWQDRLVATWAGFGAAAGTHAPVTTYSLDNQGQATETDTYDGDLVTSVSVSSSGAPVVSYSLTGGNTPLRAEVTAAFDEQERPFLTQVFSVDQNTGAVGASLNTNTYRDHRGDVIETAAPGGVATFDSFDAAGRDATTYTADGAGGAAWADPVTATGAPLLSSHVLDQVTRTFNNDGEVTVTADAQRDQDDASTNTGPLPSTNTSGQDRITYVANWFDAADRLTDTADLGTNGGQPYSYVASAPPGRNLVGQATATGSTTTLIDSSRTEPASTFIGYTLKVTAGADAGQSGTVTGYSGGTFTLSTTSPWPTATGPTSVYSLLPGTLGGTASGGSTTTLTDSTLTQPAGTFVGWTLTVTAGTDAGKTATVTANATSGSLTFAPFMPAAIDSTSQYTLTLPALLGHTDYDSAGNPFRTTDARGVATVNTYNLLNQTTQTVAAWTGNSPSSAADQTTNFTFDGNGDVISQTAVMPSGTNQVTRYVYGVTTGTASSSNPTGGSIINSNDLLFQVHYPDPSTGAASATADYPAGNNDATFTYNGLGEAATMQDENATTHTYSRDVLGQETSDSVAVPTGNPQNVDQSVLDRGFTYNTLGELVTASTYSVANPSPTATPLTQVQDVYNGLGQLTREYQSHSGAVVPQTPTPTPSVTPSVQYAYAGPASNQNYSRLSTLTYPLSSSGFPHDQVLHYVYNSGIDDNVSRVSALANDNAGGVGSHLADYQYLGTNTIVNQADGNNVTLSYYTAGSTNSDSNDEYTGLDRFNRVFEQKYLKTATPTPTATEDLQYAYSTGGDLLNRKNLLSSANSELYHANSTAPGDNATAYDLLDRLTAFRRGTLSHSAGNNNGTSGPASLDTATTASPSEGWTLDAVGNWACLTTNGSSTGRTHDSRNEITAVGANALAYDHNGNTTKDQLGNSIGYNAWNEEASYTWNSGGCGPSAGSAETFSNDALGRRVADSYSRPPTFSSCVCDFDTSDSYYYSADGQVLQNAATSVTYDPSTCGCICGCGCGCGTWCGFSCDVCCTTQSFFWGQGYVNDLVLRDVSGTDQHSDAGGSADQSTTTIGPQRLYAQHDANYDVTALLDGSGNVKQRFVYDPYGNRTALTSGWANTSDAYGWQVGFQGMWLDTNTGLYHTPNRDYSPTLGRWIQQDPERYVDGSNAFAFLGDAPASKLDPRGTNVLAAQPQLITKGQISTLDGTIAGGQTPYADEAGAWDDQFGDTFMGKMKLFNIEFRATEDAGPREFSNPDVNVPNGVGQVAMGTYGIAAYMYYVAIPICPKDEQNARVTFTETKQIDDFDGMRWTSGAPMTTTPINNQVPSTAPKQANGSENVRLAKLKQPANPLFSDVIVLADMPWSESWLKAVPAISQGVDIQKESIKAKLTVTDAGAGGNAVTSIDYSFTVGFDQNRKLIKDPPH